MTEEVREKINDILMDDLNKIEQMDITDKARMEAISNVKTLAELDIKDSEVCIKSYKEEQLVQIESTKSKVEAGKMITGFLSGLGSVILITFVSQRGIFIDKTALGFANKKW